MGYKFLIVGLTGILFRLGGAGHKWTRRIIIPILLAGYLAIKLKCWWLFPACGAGYAFVGLGYGMPDPSTGDKGSWLGRIIGIDWLTRGLYCLTVATLGTQGLVFGGYLPILGYIAYLTLNFTVGAILAQIKAPDILIEPAMGASLASIVLFV